MTREPIDRREDRAMYVRTTLGIVLSLALDAAALRAVFGEDSAGDEAPRAAKAAGGKAGRPAAKRANPKPAGGDEAPAGAATAVADLLRQGHAASFWKVEFVGDPDRPDVRKFD